MKSFGSRYKVVLVALSLMPLAHAERAKLPTRHTRPITGSGQAKLLSAMDPTQTLNLNIVLPIRNQDLLSEFVKRVSAPLSPTYRQYLTVDQFTAEFGPTEQDHSTVIAFLQANGLIITQTYPNRMVIDAQGSVANIEKAFNVSLGIYQNNADNTTFYAPAQEPTPNLSVALWHVAGLDNYSIPQPASLKKDPTAHIAATGSGPKGQFLGSDYRAAYYGGTALTGVGQSVGLLEFAGFNIRDIYTYFAKVGQPLIVAVTGVSTDGSPLTCTGKCDDSEQALDIETAISMAPGMNSVLVYVSDTSDVAIFNRMASDNIAKSLSCSWGWSPADETSDDPIFMEFAAQGQTLFVASGDNGAFSKRSKNVFPADDGYITAVGGTNLTTNGPGGSWKNETGWADSGGGISPDGIPIPIYQSQAGVTSVASKASLTYRNVPDVAAAAAENNFICFNGTCAGGWGGTSFAAPRWAGYLALSNQQAVSKGEGTAGFLNPTIYSIGLSAAYVSDLHDITSGSNVTYTTEPGYDLVTGWGSPNGSGLIDQLAP